MSSLQKKVLLAVPNQGWIHSALVVSLINISSDKRYEKYFLLPDHSRFTTIEGTRQYIKDYFLKGDYDYLLSIDDDNPPLKNPLDFIELDKDMISCVTPVWIVAETQNSIGLNAYDLQKDDEGKLYYVEHTEHEGLQEVDAVGMGCYLLARRVVKDEVIQKTPIHSVSRDDGTTLFGEDIVFCQLVKERGFKIYAHYDYSCMHFKELDLQGAYKGLKNYWN